MKKISWIKKRWPGLVALLLLMALTACEGDGGKVSPPEVAKIGQPAPNFSLLDLHGRSWELKELKGRVVFVNFWATWCPPCRREMPSMQALYMRLPPDKFKMLAILSNDEPRAAGTLAARLGCSFPILIDPGSRAAKSYGITGVPETFIIDRQGILREKIIGPWPWDSPEALELLGKYLN